MRNLPALTLLAIAGLPACRHAASPQAGTEKAQAAHAVSESPRLRLPPGARPLRYSADLDVAPERETFHGTIAIELDIAAPTSILWLNGSELTVRAATLETGASRVDARPVLAKHDFIGFSFATPVAAGHARLVVEYDGRLSQKDSRGLFRQKEGSDWYVFTQFEATDARMAFPCFDEPAYKVPWKLTLHVPQAAAAYSNTPALRQAPGPNGTRTVEFAETPPLPSYLVAFAVGPFERVDAGRAGRSGTPIGIITTRGRAAEARYAAKSTPELLALLEEYFAIAFPYAKLDLIGVPQFGGAMENPGLITFHQSLLLHKPSEETVEWRRSMADVVTHECAHLWFGDLVTTAWWDDIWLNESFATWMEPKILDRWHPDWDSVVNRVVMRGSAMAADSLVTARKIRQPIVSKDDIENAFDGITYEKGASVLAMFEAYLGEEGFRKGVQLYLRSHAWKSATAADFIAAMGTQAEKDIAPAFKSFLDQAGVPLVSAALECKRGETPALRLTQERYLPAGSTASAAELWQVPVCAKWSAHGKEGYACTLLGQAQGELALTGAPGCPDWLLANAKEVGYYRVVYRGDLLGRLLKDGAKHLTQPERVGVIGDMRALVRSGQLPIQDVLAWVPQLSRDPNRHIAESTASIVRGLKDLVPDELWPNYIRFVRRTFGARARQLGWRPAQSEPDDTRLLRSELLPLVAADGEDRVLAGEADSLARAWLMNRSALDPNIVTEVLSTAAHRGDRDLFDRFLAEARKTQDRTERERLLFAMASFRDQGIVRQAEALVLSDVFDVRESLTLLWGALDNEKTRLLTYDFVKQNFDQLVAKLPRDYGAVLPNFGGRFCDEDHRRDVETFFRDRSPRFTGGPRILAQVVEQISLCTAYRKAQQPAVVAFLKKE